MLVQPGLFINPSTRSNPCRIPMSSIRHMDANGNVDGAFPDVALPTNEEPPPPYSTLPRDAERHRANPDPRLFYPGPPPPPVIEGYIPVVSSSPKVFGTEWLPVEGARDVVVRLTGAGGVATGLTSGPSYDTDDDFDDRQTWREIGIVTLLLCPPLGILCLAFSCMAASAFRAGRLRLGRRRARAALHVAIFTMALYGCALIIYLTFKLAKPERNEEHTVFWGHV